MATDLAAPALEAASVSYRYGGEGAFSLDDVQLTFPAGSFSVVLGPNGSGKSTLVRLLGGLLVPQRGGVVRLEGRPLSSIPQKERGRAVAFLAQDEPRRVPFSVFDVVMMGRYPYQGAWPFDSTADLDVARAAMQRTDVLQFSDRLIAELSGGERQRVYLARALAQQPRILLLDEPAASLDLAHQVELYDFLRELNRDEGLTVIAVSHELNLATRYCDNVVLLRPGRVAHAGSPDDLLTEAVLGEIYEIPVRRFVDPASGRAVFLPGA